MSALIRDMPYDAFGTPLGHFAGGYPVRGHQHQVLPHTVRDLSSRSKEGLT